MKKGLWIFILTLCLFTICVLEEVLVNTTLQKVSQVSQVLYQLSEKNEDVSITEIYSLSEELKDYWKEKELLLCFFINYKDMNEMGNEIIKMVSYSKNNIKEEFTTSLSLLIYYCETFNHITGFNLQNIF